MSLTTQEVRRWAAEWIFVPQGSPTLDTEGYLLVAHPLTWTDPTAVFRIDSERPAAALVDEVMTGAAGLDRSAVTFWVHEGTRPRGLVEELVARGAVLREELALLARPICSDLPDLEAPDDVEVQVSADLATQRDFDRVGAAVFGGSHEDDAALQADLDRRDPATSAALVAYRDGAPVGAAGVTYAGEVARLWGGSVVESARSAGVYRALLARRLSDAHDRGCRVALVKGRLTTSAPVLRRAGFAEHGEERGYRLILR